MRKLALASILCAIAGFTTFVVARGLDLSNLAPSLRSEWQPFTMETVETVEDFSSQTTTTSRSFYAIREDGSKVRGGMDAFADGMFYQTKLVKLLPQRKMVLVTDAVQSTTTDYVSEEFARSVGPPNFGSNCIPDLASEDGWKVNGSEEIHGLQTVRMEKTGERVHLEAWRAPALNCALLRSITESYDQDGKIISRTTQEAESLELGRPRDKYFSIPEGYTELSHMQRAQAIVQQFEGGLVPACALTPLYRQERAYWDSRSSD